MKRSGFKVQRPPRPAKQLGDGYTLRPRAVSEAWSDHRARMTVGKFVYVRDEAFQLMCRGMTCKHCGRGGPDAGVTWAHSNQGQHGHGRAIKASDIFVAALCWTCHGRLDQGGDWTQAERVAVWDAAHRLTVALAVELETWPKGYAVPVFEDDR